MSIVRYTNKKTGVVTLYESTSHYDPETKQSRPIRKYLGVEDPETGKLIPSSGLRGRKKADGSAPSKREQNESKYKAKYEKLQRESNAPPCQVINYLSLPPSGQNMPVACFEWRIAALSAAAIGKVSAKLTCQSLPPLGEGVSEADG